MQGPDEWNRYAVTGIPYDRRTALKLYDAGFDTEELTDGYIVAPGILAPVAAYAKLISSVLDTEVHYISAIEHHNPELAAAPPGSLPADSTYGLN
jgi:hypothetical protein